MRVLFWGTPDFGLPSLDALGSAGHEVVGVVTNPDRPAGRGRRVTASPVKRWAYDAGVPVLQPVRPRGGELLARLRELAPDLSVVAAYGQILVDDVLALPACGSINVHASLLPRLRGAAPVNWAIIRGDEESGATIMRMVAELDAGPVFERRSVPIDRHTTAGGLYETIARCGAEALVEVVGRIEEGTAVEVPQDDELATYAPKLDRETARLDWTLDADEVGRWMRGCDPWPGGWTTLGGEPLQCFAPVVGGVGARAAGPESGIGSESRAGGSTEPGTIVSADPRRGLEVATGGGTILVREVKPAGKRRMPAEAWVRGRKGLEGARLA